MSERVLPEGWVEITLGQVVEYGKAEKATREQVDGDTWVLELEDIEKSSSRVIQRLSFSERQFKSTKNCFKKGDVLYGKLRPYLDKVVIADRDGVCTTEIVPLDARPHLDNRYLFYWLKSSDFLSYVNKVGYGVNMPRLGTKDGKSAPFVLVPREEHKSIADKLDKLLAQVNNLKARLDAIPAILKRFRQSVLAAAVSGRLMEEWRKEKRLRPALEVELGSLIHEGPQNGIYKPLSAYGEGVRIIRIDGFYDGELVSWSGMRRLEISCEELGKWRVNTGDILINRVNSIEYLGKCALVRSLPEDAVFESNIMRFSVDPEKAIPEYVMRCLSSRSLKRQLVGRAKHAVNQASINQKDVKNCVIPLPHIEEQAEIVRRVDQLFAFADQIEQQVRNAQARVNKLTQSILAKAFRGELTADWRAENPELISGEHSAEALLERIKAEKAAISPKRRSRKGKVSA